MERKHNNNFMWGVILVCVGILSVLGSFGIIPSLGSIMSKFWPMILIFISLLFHAGYYSNRKNVGLLVPGGILLALGIVFQTSELWNVYDVMWPGCMLAPAVGLFELYIFGKRQKGLLIPIGILTGISLLFFTLTIRNLGGISRFILPAILVVSGFVMVAKGKKENNSNYDDNM
ncbi:MAG TPA: DUF5668 domain-containing protein [Thermoclostridium sp.]|nr:DUF5668 domain-containing protein [Thermoclostridium sp.]